MKALTIQQPYAWAVAYGHKRLENRTGPAWRYRGPVAIHAGSRWSDRGAHDAPVLHAWGWHSAGPAATPDEDEGRWKTARVFASTGQVAVPNARDVMPTMAVVAVAELADAHPAGPDCCGDPWALTEYGGKAVTTHYLLDDVRALAVPVPVPGRLGLWVLPDDVAAQVAAQCGGAA